MMRRLTLGLALLSTLILSASAMAAAPTTNVPPMQTAQTELRGSLGAFGLDVKAERVAVNHRGRRDLVIETRGDAQSIADDMIQAYRTRRALPNGYKITGWTHLARSGNYTFTVRKNRDVSYVFEVAADGGDATVRIWGSYYEDRPTRTVPESSLPSRYNPLKKRDYIVR